MKFLFQGESVIYFSSVYTLKDISASQERLCHLLSKNYKSACAICWENIILHSHPEMEISFKFIPKMLMSKDCIHFFGPLCIFPHYLANIKTFGKKFLNMNYAFWFSLQRLSETFLTLRRTERDTIKNVYWSSCEVPVFLVRF